MKAGLLEQLSLGRITHITILGLLPTLQTQKGSALHFHKTFFVLLHRSGGTIYLLHFTLLLKTNV